MRSDKKLQQGHWVGLGRRPLAGFTAFTAFAAAKPTARQRGEVRAATIGLVKIASARLDVGTRKAASSTINAMSSRSTPRKSPKRWTNAPPKQSLPGSRRGSLEDPEISALLLKTLVNWPHLEDQMISVFQDLLGIPKSDLDSARLLFTALVNQKIRIHVMRELLERSRRNRSVSGDYDAVLKEFEALNGIRNKYVHGLWWTHENGETHLQLDNSAFFAHAEYHLVTLGEVQTFWERLDALWWKTINLQRLAAAQ